MRVNILSLVLFLGILSNFITSKKLRNDFVVAATNTQNIEGSSSKKGTTTMSTPTVVNAEYKNQNLKNSSGYLTDTNKNVIKSLIKY